MEIVGCEVDEAGSPSSFSSWVVHNKQTNVESEDNHLKINRIITPVSLLS